MNPALRLVLFVMLDHFLNDEVQEFLGEFRVQIGLLRKIGQPCDLRGFARRIGRAAQEFDLGATPTTKVNFAAIGAAPDPSWAKQA